MDPPEAGDSSLLMKRSIWGVASVYNKLGDALCCRDVKGFQFLLQERAKRVVSKRLLSEWEFLYSPRRCVALACDIGLVRCSAQAQ